MHVERTVEKDHAIIFNIPKVEDLVSLKLLIRLTKTVEGKSVAGIPTDDFAESFLLKDIEKLISNGLVWFDTDLDTYRLTSDGKLLTALMDYERNQELNQTSDSED